jgi:NAD(P)-dependent dehydrogenase (short-subunit alcohol dehydrogenase family)
LQRLKDKIAIVTGAAKGNGKGIAKALAREGAITVLTDVSDEVYQSAKEIQTLGYNAVPMKMDVTDFDDVSKTVKNIVDRFGKIDILVNNAGIYPHEPLICDMTEEFWDRIFNVNVKGVFYCTKAVLPHMMKNKSGKIINISSVTGPMVSTPRSVCYSASKGAVSAFTRGLALQLAEYGINVNAICPGYVDTPGARENFGDDFERVAQSVPLKRFGTPDELGDLVVFLASDESKYITGTEIVFDGGNIIQELKTIV